MRVLRVLRVLLVARVCGVLCFVLFLIRFTQALWDVGRRCGKMFNKQSFTKKHNAKMWTALPSAARTIMDNRYWIDHSETCTTPRVCALTTHVPKAILVVLTPGLSRTAFVPSCRHETASFHNLTARRALCATRCPRRTSTEHTRPNGQHLHAN